MGEIKLKPIDKRNAKILIAICMCILGYIGFALLAERETENAAILGAAFVAALVAVYSIAVRFHLSETAQVMALGRKVIELLLNHLTRK
jgi:predicted tellurium resistance membrane protein TerC